MSESINCLKNKLSSAHHIVYYHGWDDLLATHLSVRVANTNKMLITPLNVPFEEVSADKIIVCDLDGNILNDNGYTMMPQAINIHAEVYKRAAHIGSIMHTHSTYGLAIASLECGFMFFNQQALRFYDDIAYHDYNGLALDNEGVEIAESLGDKTVMILKNHGLITTGESIEQALYRLYYMEKCCELQIKTQASGQTIQPISSEICEKTKAQFDKIAHPDFEFQALVRRVTR
ncbi:MAG: class II aldolase/adducin family protein [Francisellaceae bacterium]